MLHLCVISGYVAVKHGTPEEGDIPLGVIMGGILFHLLVHLNRSFGHVR